MFVTSGASYQLGSIQNLPWQTIFHKFDCPANFETLTTRARMKVVQGGISMTELFKKLSLVAKIKRIFPLPQHYLFCSISMKNQPSAILTFKKVKSKKSSH